MRKTGWSINIERLLPSVLLALTTLQALLACSVCVGRPLQPPVAPKFHHTIHAAFRKVVDSGSRSTVKVVSDGRLVALGTVVREKGFFLTKWSVLRGKVHCLTRDGKPHNSQIVAHWPNYDLALLRASTLRVPPIKWSQTLPVVGSWVIAPRQIERWVSVGIISRNASSLAYSLGSFGILLDEPDRSLRCEEILANSQAERAGLRSGDQFTHIGQSKLHDASELKRLLGLLLPGQSVSIRVKRLNGPKRLAFSVPKDGVLPNSPKSPYVSQRRFGISLAFEHDGVLSPSDCGGPLVDLSGQAVGINIARASRAASYTIPAGAIVEILEQYEFPAIDGQVISHRR